MTRYGLSLLQPWKFTVGKFPTVHPSHCVLIQHLSPTRGINGSWQIVSWQPVKTPEGWRGKSDGQASQLGGVCNLLLVMHLNA